LYSFYTRLITLPLFSSSLPRHPTPPLFPYTTLFRSQCRNADRGAHRCRCGGGDRQPCRLFADFGLVSRAPARDGTRDLFLGPLSNRKSTRLNSSHVKISYAVFCLKKKIIKENRSKLK